MKNPIRRLVMCMLMVAVCGSSRVGAAAEKAGKQAGAAGEQKELTPLQKELLRINAVQAWAAKTNPSPKEYGQKMYEPIIEGNKRDAVEHMKTAAKLAANAEEAGRKLDDKGVKKWEYLAKGYHALAEQNRAAVAAFEKGDSAGFDAALAKIREIEDKITEVMGKRPQRSWISPAELQGMVAAANAQAAVAQPGAAQPKANPK